MSSPPSSGCAKWFSITLIALALIASVTIMLSFDRLQRLANTIFGAATQTNITDSFRESLLKVTGTQGDILEVATLEMDETFTRRNAKTVGWNLFYIGTTVSEVRAPAVYRYHIKLSDAWDVQLSADRKSCIVTAPTIRPSSPPAIRTDKMEKKSTAGWARFNAADNLADLEKTITPSLEARAGLADHITQVREPSREAVRKFVETWLMGSVVTAGEALPKVVVRFVDEAAQLP